MNSLIDNTDPTRDLRALIEHLHQTARESRTQTQRAEREKEQLAGQLEKALADLHDARDREADVRSRFIEITSVISERDAAIAAGERQAQQLQEMQKLLEAITRERDQAIRHRQETAHRADSAARSAQTLTAQLQQVERQVISIRQARDGATSRVREVEEKLARAEDTIAELEYSREAAQTAQRQAADQVAEIRKQLDGVTLDRQAMTQQVEELLGELDLQRKKVLDLSAGAQQADQQQAAALAEACEQVSSISAERDAARARSAEQAKEIDELRQQLQCARSAQTAQDGIQAELEEARRQLTVLSAERDAQYRRQEQTSAELVSQQEQLDSLSAQLAEAQRGHQDAVDALTAAERQAEYILHDREMIISQSNEKVLTLEGQLNEARGRGAELDKTLAEMRRMSAELEKTKEKLRVLTQRFEQQRLESIELATRYDTAKRDLIELTAHMAELRLQMRSPGSGKVKGHSPGDAVLPAGASSELASTAPAKVEPEIPPVVHEPLTEKTSRSAFAAMRRCFQDFTKESSDLSLINELYSHIHGFAEEARISGFVALHRLSTAFAEFTHGLYRIPDQITPGTLRTLQQTIEFLAALVKEANLGELKDPATTSVYAVDDDADNCQAIAMAMETVMIRTTYSQEPDLALAELAETRFDLIFLDINLPRMNGFDLCTRIRQLPKNANTPIVFLTGFNTREYREQSTRRGADEFIGKPFNLHELSVKTLSLILKSQRTENKGAGVHRS